MEVVKPPNRELKELRVFLAGSIEMGTAVDWQAELADMLKDVEGLTLFNPRRDDWDSSWKQSIDSPQFVEQVEWELDMMEAADFIVMYFDVNTKSPITLLELGLYATSRKLIVCCPEGFYRKGNVDVVCQHYKVMQAMSLKAIADAIKKYINK
jgi:hypothetical protein